MKSEAQQIAEAEEAFLFSIPDDKYDLCPCGCGKKWRYVEKGGEKEIAAHAQTFVKSYLAKNAPKE